jgi:glycosyltransferase involved in cell wall biosynthesis
MHPRIKNLISNSTPAKYVYYKRIPISLAGYFDYIQFYSRAIKNTLKSSALNTLVSQQEFNFIHALEMQGAGYLLAEITIPENSKVIFSNWGSDISYFMRFEDHLAQIKKALSIVDAYSAECVRDYELARELGFEGEFLPCIPNAGGHEIPESYLRPEDRTQIIIKGYGGEFGLAGIVLDITPYVLENYPWVSMFFYSVTPDLQDRVLNLVKSYGSRVRMQTINRKISHHEMQKEFQRSRIYIGCSKSDGISTSFLEALANGTYPIQTNTSCAYEWVTKGAVASIVNPNSREILDEVISNLDNITKLDIAFEANTQLAKRELNPSKLSELSAEFYAI